MAGAKNSKRLQSIQVLKTGFIFIFWFGLWGCSSQRLSSKPVPIIFDTDIGPDYDDVGAIAMLHALENEGAAKILATVASNKYEGVAAVLNVFNTYFYRPQIPIGVPKGSAIDMKDSQFWTDSILSKYPHEIKTNAEAPDAVAVYRKALASQADKSVTVITVGFVTNLANLLKSPGDRYSPLNGKELIEKKVKVLVSMAGKFPAGREFNLEKDARASFEVFNNWPTNIIYSGFEIGSKIKTGLPLINNSEIVNSPVKDVFRIAIPKSPQDAGGRMSWDQTAVLVGVKGYAPFYNLHPGRMVVKDNGENSWDDNGRGQFYLVEKEDPHKVQEVINQLMMQAAKKK